MSERGLADREIVPNEVTKSLTKPKNKISGIMKVAVAVMVIISGLKMLRHRKQTG